MGRRPKGNPDVKVKICGITNWADARMAVEAGADFLGFNFYRRSPRYIEPAKAGAIVRRLPKGVGAVGVFVNEDQEAIVKIADDVGLDAVQLHGEESPGLVARLAWVQQVIKAFRVSESLDYEKIRQYPGTTAILLDGFDAKRRGGTGKTFDWKLARRMGKRVPIILAGGLTAENVSEAIRIARPYAIDVCSGVERAPGKKDAGKMRAFVRAAKGPEWGSLPGDDFGQHAWRGKR